MSGSIRIPTLFDVVRVHNEMNSEFCARSTIDGAAPRRRRPVDEFIYH